MSAPAGIFDAPALASIANVQRELPGDERRPLVDARADTTAGNLVGFGSMGWRTALAINALRGHLERVEVDAEAILQRERDLWELMHAHLPLEARPQNPYRTVADLPGQLFSYRLSGPQTDDDFLLKVLDPPPAEGDAAVCLAAAQVAKGFGVLAVDGEDAAVTLDDLVMRHGPMQEAGRQLVWYRHLIRKAILRRHWQDVHYDAPRKSLFIFSGVDLEGSKELLPNVTMHGAGSWVEVPGSAQLSYRNGDRGPISWVSAPAWQDPNHLTFGAKSIGVLKGKQAFDTGFRVLRQRFDPPKPSEWLAALIAAPPAEAPIEEPKAKRFGKAK